jgi:hypothetical protein
MKFKKNSFKRVINLTSLIIFLSMQLFLSSCSAVKAVTEITFDTIDALLPAAEEAEGVMNLYNQKLIYEAQKRKTEEEYEKHNLKPPW